MCIRDSTISPYFVNNPKAENYPKPTRLFDHALPHCDGAFGAQVAPCVVIRAPAQRAVATDDLFRRPEVVVDDMGEIAVLQPRHRAEAVWLEEPINGVCPVTRFSDLARDDVAIPDERDLGVLAGFRHTAPEEVMCRDPCPASPASRTGRG